MATYKLVELPNVNDPRVIECCVRVQQMRTILANFNSYIVNQLGTNAVTIATRVAMAISHRMTEGSLSTELLCLKNRSRDASILILSLYELQLDLQYIALDIARADTWIDHTLEKKKPWSVRSQLEAVYQDQDELKCQLDFYKQYSMAKHGNPLGSSFSFPLAVTRDALLLDMSKANPPLTPIHLFGLGVCLDSAGDAASRIWSAQGLEVGAFAADMKGVLDRLSRLNEEHLIGLITEAGLSEFKL